MKEYRIIELSRGGTPVFRIERRRCLIGWSTAKWADEVETIMEFNSLEEAKKEIECMKREHLPDEVVAYHDVD